MAKLDQVCFTHGGSRGGTNRRQLYPGGWLWGIRRTHLMFSFVEVSVTSPMYDSTCDAGDIIGVDNAWLRDWTGVPTTIMFDQTQGTPQVNDEIHFHLIGYDQFDQLREEDVAVGPFVSANDGEYASTKYAYSRMITAECTLNVGAPTVRISQKNIGEGALADQRLGLPFMFDDPFIIAGVDAYDGIAPGTLNKGRLVTIGGDADLYKWDIDGITGAQDVSFAVDTDAATVFIPRSNQTGPGWIIVQLDTDRAEWKI